MLGVEKERPFDPLRIVRAFGGRGSPTKTFRVSVDIHVLSNYLRIPLALRTLYDVVSSFRPCLVLIYILLEMCHEKERWCNGKLIWLRIV